MGKYKGGKKVVIRLAYYYYCYYTITTLGLTLHLSVVFTSAAFHKNITTLALD